ncbi:hypothetical protein E2N92_12610 [Methanofollis formosanus]|uniref:Uncharacterized protein n=1 Tax=Methanofollis formosanus TaxID=299308 RepID=A0A8G1A2Y8_9EURY|nr:FxLYD domain-containing protein [Methanofollis formosanus]QYZ80212.1 hypothetical protein E2N92_12610 [Methanofollis formosanus]
MNTLKLLSALLVLSAAVILTAGCSGPADKAYDSQSIQANSSSHGGELEIVYREYDWSQEGYLHVGGTAKNVGDETLSSAQVDVKCYDKDGVLLRTKSDLVRDLEPGESWEYNVTYLVSDIEGYYNFETIVGNCS